MPTPQLSVMLKNFSTSDPGSWRPLLEAAKAADLAGVDRIAISDHVVFGENLEAYGDSTVGGIEGGKQPTGPDGMWLEPITLLSVLAGITTTVRLATGILQAALRRPVVLAKEAATLDVLSGGRLDLGVGVGWQREEYEAAGLSFEGRGRLLNETLAVCQALWREERVNFDSDGLHFEGIHCMPKPLQPGGVPILVSGTLNDRVIDRVVRFGDGWIPWGPDAKDPVVGIARLREALAAAGQRRQRFPGLWKLARREGTGPVDRSGPHHGGGPCPGRGGRHRLSSARRPHPRTECENRLARRDGRRIPTGRWAQLSARSKRAGDPTRTGDTP